MVMTFICLINITLSYFNIDLELLSYLGSNSILTIVFFYISSYVFKFCAYHRMFMHYTTSVWVINIYDMCVGIPLDDRGMLLIYLMITGVSLFIILYFYVKHHKESTTKNNR
jgi:hypothetical protein